jgi:ATP-binding cassette subfamily G (WHITE) protein 2
MQLVPLRLVLASAVFYAVQLSGSFLLFWLVYYFTLGNGVILAYLISALSPNMEAANALLPTYVVTLLFFTGFLIRPADTPDYWKWYTHVAGPCAQSVVRSQLTHSA